MGHTLLCVLELFLLNTLLYGHAEDSEKTRLVPKSFFANKAVVTLQPNWSEIHGGETITLRCEIEDGGDTEWTYEWTTTSSEKTFSQNEIRIRSADVSHSGDYRCLGRMKSGQMSSTDWSDPIKLTVSDRPRPVLTVSPSWPSPGDSVTLKCEVQHPSAGWRFYWYKVVPKLSYSFLYTSKLLPDSTSGTEEDSYIIHGQTHTAGYMCAAGRGHPVFYTQFSELKFVWSADFHSSASLTVNPDRVQHFIKDSVSLNCEGNSAEWRVMMFTDNSYTSYSTWRTKTGYTCNINSDQQGEAVFWCESGSGEFSNAVNITVQDEDIILVSPVHPVTEGHSVSLSCKLRRQNFVSNVFFYKNGIIIQRDSRSELDISAVSKSDEGFYKCQQSGQESAQSWMSVQVSTPGDSSLPVLLIVGLLCGIVLIILLILLIRYKPSKDSCCNRSIQSESTNQVSDTNHVVDQNEAHHDQYSTLLHGDVCLYESIKSPEDSENDDSQNAAGSSTEL